MADRGYNAIAWDSVLGLKKTDHSFTRTDVFCSEDGDFMLRRSYHYDTSKDERCGESVHMYKKIPVRNVPDYVSLHEKLMRFGEKTKPYPIDLLTSHYYLTSGGPLYVSRNSSKGEFLYGKEYRKVATDRPLTGERIVAAKAVFHSHGNLDSVMKSEMHIFDYEKKQDVRARPELFTELIKAFLGAPPIKK